MRLWLGYRQVDGSELPGRRVCAGELVLLCIIEIEMNDRRESMRDTHCAQHSCLRSQATRPYLYFHWLTFRIKKREHLAFDIYLRISRVEQTRNILYMYFEGRKRKISKRRKNNVLSYIYKTVKFDLLRKYLSEDVTPGRIEHFPIPAGNVYRCWLNDSHDAKAFQTCMLLIYSGIN